MYLIVILPIIKDGDKLSSETSSGKGTTPTMSLGIEGAETMAQSYLSW